MNASAYSAMAVDRLIALFLADEGHQDTIFQALWERYRPLVIHYYRKFYNLHMERQDFDQEMALSLWQAVKSYEPKRGVTFGAYLSLRLYHRCLDLYRYHCHQKRLPKAGLTSLEQEVADGLTLADTIKSTAATGPEYALSFRETLRLFRDKLSRLEAKVVDEVSTGSTFQELSAHYAVTEGRVKRAYYRSHQKLKRLLKKKRD